MEINISLLLAITLRNGRRRLLLNQQATTIARIMVEEKFCGTVYQVKLYQTEEIVLSTI